MLARSVEHERHLQRQIQADLLAKQVVLVLTGHQQRCKQQPGLLSTPCSVMGKALPL